MEAHHQQNGETLTKQKGSTMLEATRVYRFTSSIEGKGGNLATLSALYRVSFRKNDIEDYVYIVIKPDFGPAKHLRISDVGITWKSLLKAWQWCSANAMQHLATWQEMDIQEGAVGGHCVQSGAIVIPDKQLSTGLG